MTIPTSSHPVSGNSKKPFWHILTSVRLAISLFILLAITSIIGTLIPQGESLHLYLEKYGPSMFQVIKVARLHDMYNSWWFIALLLLFAVNLVACTINRFPIISQLYKKDTSLQAVERLLKMPHSFVLSLPSAASFSKEDVNKILPAPVLSYDVENGRLFFKESGKWSYWGVYILHTSILIILAGALIGAIWGFKGQIMLAEGEKVSEAVERFTGKDFPLGFELYCEKFFVDFYDTGAPKEFRSDLVIFESGKEVLRKSIRVNEPLSYHGLTFYQSSYDAMPLITFTITSADGKKKVLSLPVSEKISWQEAGLSVGVMQFLPNIHGGQAAHVWIGDDGFPPEAIWFLKGAEKEFRRGNNIYKASITDVEQRYMTGLQVKKDPGVWVVWFGCAGMLLGFGVVFWVAHRRIWLWVGERNGRPTLILAGRTNKNNMQFERFFDEMEQKIRTMTGVKI
jgi:cytochrome c biogenesis protein